MGPVIGISAPFRAGEEVPGDAELTRHIRMLDGTGAAAFPLHVGPESAAAIYERKIDGLILSGGADVEPALYGGDARRCESIRDGVRDRSEIALLIAAMAMNLPILCVCRGLQLANVAMGGTLIEDLHQELGSNYIVKHHQVRELGASRTEYSHAVDAIAHSRLAAIAQQRRFQVNSTHHQAIRDLAPGLTATARSEDGVIEAAEFKNSGEAPFFIGVQWHPEALGRNDPVSTRLFDALIASAAERSEKMAESRMATKLR